MYYLRYADKGYIGTTVYKLKPAVHTIKVKKLDTCPLFACPMEPYENQNRFVRNILI